MRRLIPVFFVILLFACNAVDFSPSRSADTNPSCYNQVLAEGENIFIDFSFEPEHSSAESAFSIESAMGSLTGNFEWAGDKMIFSPSEEFIPSRRYHLSFVGKIEDSDGKAWDFNIHVPFFYKSADQTVPYVVNFFPECGTRIKDYDRIVVDFSTPINPTSLLNGLIISPGINYNKVWSSDFTHLEIIPEEKWSEGEVYKFTFCTDLKSSADIPFESEISYYLYSTTGAKNPTVTSVSGIDALHLNDEIQITFSEPMERTKTENSISFEPSIAGQKFWKDSQTISFKPENGWICGTSYTLTVSNSAQSEAGLTMSDDHGVEFTPAIDYLKLIRLEGLSTDGFPITDFNICDEIDIDAGDTLAVENNYTLGFVFSEPFNTDTEKEEACSKIKLSGIFPSSLSNPKIVSYIWGDSRTLFIRFKGFIPGGKIYQLSVSGGRNGIMTGAGNFLEENINLFLRTK